MGSIGAAFGAKYANIMQRELGRVRVTRRVANSRRVKCLRLAAGSRRRTQELKIEIFKFLEIAQRAAGSKSGVGAKKARSFWRREPIDDLMHQLAWQSDLVECPAFYSGMDLERLMVG